MSKHVQLSDQIRPWDTLACCCGVKRSKNESPYVGGDRQINQPVNQYLSVGLGGNRNLFAVQPPDQLVKLTRQLTSELVIVPEIVRG